MIQIRHFEPRDSEEIKKLITGIMDGEFSQEKAAFSFDDLETIGDAYGSLGEAFFVAEEDQKVIGTIAVKREDERVALIRRIFVALPYRKKKVGLRLLNRAVDFCKEVGYRELMFKTTSRMTGAIELFKKEGFHPRAKVPMGNLELVKLTLSLKGERN